VVERIGSAGANHRGHSVAEPQPKALTAEDAKDAEERPQRKIKI
jgi:hypothetical protein